MGLLACNFYKQFHKFDVALCQRCKLTKNGGMAHLDTLLNILLRGCYFNGDAAGSSGLDPSRKFEIH